MIGQTTRRVDSIDCFRAISILLVISFHYLVRWAPPYSTEDLYGFSTPYNQHWELGSFGVHFFFIISGIVISLTLGKSRNPIDFAIRRVSRIYPALLVAALLTFTICNTFGPPSLQRNLADLGASILMVPSLSSHMTLQWVDGVYWSLAVELKFYVFVAAAHFALKDRYWAGIAVVGLLGLAVSRLNLGIADKVLIFAYMPFFIWGIAIYYLVFEKKVMVAAWNFGIAAFLFLAGTTSFLPLQNLPTQMALSFVAAGAILIALLMHLRVVLAFTPLLYIGRISYSLYLVHENIGLVLIRAMKKSAGVSDLLSVAVALGVCVVLAGIMFRLIEQPTQSWIRRLYDTWRADRVLLSRPDANVRN
jgi:peptidoglycan/LPS O-acetylase OafA/YrhL